MVLEFLHVSCYTKAQQSRGVGIQTFRTDGAPLDPVPLSEPSYLCRHPRLPALYAVCEREASVVTGFRTGADGDLALINSLPTGGSGGCHLAFDPSGRFLIVAHYAVGSISVLRVRDDGALAELVAQHRFTGSGPVAGRQEASHAHMAVMDGGTVLVPDLGADRIHRIRIGADGSVTAQEPVVTPPGSGPRHLVVLGDRLVLACELSGELWLARRTASGWQGITSVRASRSTIPTAPSAIVATPDGRVLVANRGPDTFATFRLEPAGRPERAEPPADTPDTAETLTLLDETSTGGAWPRDLVHHADRVWIANQHSDAVTVFGPADGGWQQIRSYHCPSPNCLVFTPAGGGARRILRPRRRIV